MSTSEAENQALINYPQQALFGRALPKSKIYEHSGASTRLKDMFVEQVEQIVWQYKLSPETINLPAKPGVAEIQVFRVSLKTAELSDDVLKCIDGAVQFPILFELEHAGRVKVTAAYKHPGAAAGGKWTVSDYFSTAWMPSDTRRANIPMVTDLGGLYEALVGKLIPLTLRAHESLPALLERFEAVKAKERELENARAALSKEKHFHRKIEINRKIKELSTVIDTMGQ